MRAFEELTKQMEEDRRRALEERQARIDLHDLLSTEAGYRWLSRLLERLGAGRMTASEEAQVMKNIAEQILDAMADAHPDAYLRFCGDLRRVNINSRGEEDEREPHE